MVISLLKGGLGNQMFQYAAGKALALSIKTKLKLDLSFLIKNNYQKGDYVSRPFELHIFPNVKEATTDYDFEAWPRWTRRAAQKFRFPKMHRYIEPSHLFQKDFFSLKAPLLIDGYWQTEKYFIEHETAIREAFTFPPFDKADMSSVVLDEIMQSGESVSVHIRRGDYMNKAILEFHGICPLSYYEEALAYMQNQFPNATFFFFSDDTEWVKQNLTPLVTSYSIIEGNGSVHAWKDMCLMSNCRHHIIANSSFSWWGAWLNSNPAKTVIAPKQWFANPDLQLQTNNICPEKWIRLQLDK